MQFTKLFNSILDSTIWQEAKETKLVWITMLAMCDKNGEIHASIPGLAVRSGVTISECEAALLCLLSEDKYSRTKTDEGRRIAEIDGGWLLINHGKYRELLSKEERREYLAQKQREHRAKNVSTTVNKGSDKSTQSTHTDTDTDTDTDTEVSVSLSEEVPLGTAIGSTLSRIEATMTAQLEKPKKQKIQIEKPNEVDEQAWLDWLAARNAKNLGPVTGSVLKRVKSEADKLGWTIVEAIEYAASKSQGGFEADWVNNNRTNGQHSKSQNGKTQLESVMEKVRATLGVKE